MDINGLEYEVKEIVNKIEGFFYGDIDKNIEEFKD